MLPSTFGGNGIVTEPRTVSTLRVGLAGRRSPVRRASPARRVCPSRLLRRPQTVDSAPRDLQQPRRYRARHRLRAHLRLVDQQVLEPRHPPPLRRRVRYQVRKLPLVPPPPRSLIAPENRRFQHRSCSQPILLWCTYRATCCSDAGCGGVSAAAGDGVGGRYASPSLTCAVGRRCVPAGASPARQLSLQPEAVGAVQGGNELD